MRILIICNDFPPLNSIGALRPFSWYQWFKEFGAEPIVVTKHWPINISKPEDVLKVKISSNEIKEETKFGTIYRMPTKSILPDKILATYGQNKLIFIRKILTFIYKILSFPFFSFDKHAALFKKAEQVLATGKIDLILISGEPFILFKYGYLLKKKFNIPWVADYRDAWWKNNVSRLKRDPLNRLLQLYEFQFEKKYVSNCNFFCTPDPSLRKLLSTLHNKECNIIYNGFENFLPPLPLENKTENKTLLLTHTGTLTIGQRVEFILKALLELVEEKKISKGDIILQFTGLEYFNEQLMRVTGFNKNILPFIKTTPRLPRNQALQINQSSDFLLSFTETNSQSLFAKVYDYIACRKPILVMPDDNGLMSNIINETNSGLSFKTIQELKDFLLGQIARKKNGEPTLSFLINEEKALFYTRKNQAKRLVKFLNRLINSAI